MPFTTPEQFIVLALLLLGGWLIGYASAPSPRKWKRKARDQSERFTTYHAEAEDRLRAANRRASDLNAEAEALRADHAEAERTIARLRAAAVAVPVAAVVSDPAPVEAQPVAADTVSDDVTRIRGIDAALATRLAEEGVTRFEDIDRLSHEEETALEQKLDLPVGEIAREQWRAQAVLLCGGRDDEHAAPIA